MSEYCVGGVCYKKVVVRCLTQCLSTVLEECVIRRLLSGVGLSVEYCVGGVYYKKVVVRCSPQSASTVLEECVIRRLLPGVRLSVGVLCWRSVL